MTNKRLTHKDSYNGWKGSVAGRVFREEDVRSAVEHLKTRLNEHYLIAKNHLKMDHDLNESKDYSKYWKQMLAYAYVHDILVPESFPVFTESNSQPISEARLESHQLSAVSAATESVATSHSGGAEINDQNERTDVNPSPQCDSALSVAPEKAKCKTCNTNDYKILPQHKHCVRCITGHWVKECFCDCKEHPYRRHYCTCICHKNSLSQPSFSERTKSDAVDYESTVSVVSKAGELSVKKGSFITFTSTDVKHTPRNGNCPCYYFHDEEDGGSS